MKDKFPIIQTERLLLRQFTDEDLENVYRALSHPDVIKYYGVSYNSLEATKEQLEWFYDMEKLGTGIWWAINSPDNKDFYGAIGLYFLKEEHRKAEVGFWLLPDYWGKGIITEVMPLICSYVFNEMDLHRIEAFVETENIKSKKVMEKLNFDHEGTMRDCEIKKGRFISLDIYAKLRPSNL